MGLNILTYRFELYKKREAIENGMKHFCSPPYWGFNRGRARLLFARFVGEMAL